MRNLQFSGALYGERVTLQQINKPAALKLFTAGGTVYLQSSNFHPLGVWSQAMDITLDTEELQSARDHYEFCVKGGYELPVHTPDAQGQFNERCNNFAFYNCTNETGRYITFYQSV